MPRRERDRRGFVGLRSVLCFWEPSTMRKPPKEVFNRIQGRDQATWRPLRLGSPPARHCGRPTQERKPAFSRWVRTVKVRYHRGLLRAVARPCKRTLRAPAARDLRAEQATKGHRLTRRPIRRKTDQTALTGSCPRPISGDCSDGRHGSPLRESFSREPWPLHARLGHVCDDRSGCEQILGLEVLFSTDGLGVDEPRCLHLEVFRQAVVSKRAVVQ